MKLRTLGGILIVLVGVIQILSPTLIRATAIGRGPVGEEKVTCDIKGLEPCLLPLISHKEIPPTPHCCATLTEHQPCYCGYLKDYWLGPELKSPDAHKVFDACKIPFPTCP
ncbi:hypothetical protein EUTSA_v10005361mg [Eutrema salsugineum]|uniref:Bifunctional inhibitor/plant lipid transfer protein/seed storage helical domain-containing protein n=1 Tax=Eutrema salsugineum TaxID=72664 RepID=V4KMT9_EUTSA|nr:non-specific lipid-transfer protein 2 [Eutrema salsugineum]ESQ32589.1 hypothetical protein EUTSA_v10005361mg [Eutrema salsugineum]